ncbi:hypothetical protein OG792_05785 [Micromonospora sp. NBC_01699]|uniref:hypothetical protein n=1 Tax=Micromonospora sp. NBC_01699 TaxID=2975984 RepID=UPI002E3531C9|nr:hypothetical protein [Micromonospora sp. NBC_01699]
MSGAESAGTPVRIIRRHGLRYGPAREADVRRCEELLLGGHGLTHIGYYTGGAYDFTLSLVSGPVAGVDPDPAEEDGWATYDRDADDNEVEDHEAAGGHVVHDMAELDQELRPADSGDLIRFVLQGRDAALFCLRVARGQFLFGVAPTPPPEPGDHPPQPAWVSVQAADRAMSALANDLRASFHQRQIDYGGWLWLTEQGLESATPDDAPVAPVDNLAELDARMHDSPELPPTDDPDLYADPTGDDPRAYEVCRRYLSADDLHYTALCRGGRVMLAVDVLGADRLGHFFRGVDVPERRLMYREFGTRVEERVRNLTRGAYLTIGERLARAVLDVEQGAVFCYPLTNGDYLLAVTLDQDKVQLAEVKVAHLAAELTALGDGAPVSGPRR